MKPSILVAKTFRFVTEGAATTAAAVADFSAIAVALIVQAAWAMGTYLAMGFQYGYTVYLYRYAPDTS